MGNLEDNGLGGIATAGNDRLSSSRSFENVFYLYTSLIRKFDKNGRSLSFFGSFTPQFVDKEGHSLSDIRYYNIDKYAVSRARMKMNDEIDLAVDYFSKARSFHMSIEKYYTASMDFDGINDRTERLIEEIFKGI